MEKHIYINLPEYEKETPLCIYWLIDSSEKCFYCKNEYEYEYDCKCPKNINIITDYICISILGKTPIISSLQETIYRIRYYKSIKLKIKRKLYETPLEQYYDWTIEPTYMFDICDSMDYIETNDLVKDFNFDKAYDNYFTNYRGKLKSYIHCENVLNLLKKKRSKIEQKPCVHIKPKTKKKIN